MAEEDQANLSISAEHVEELLRCPICWDRFKTPKLLPCQHTFCQAPCLEQLVNRFNQIKCPECRVEHRVPYNGVSALPNNRTIINFLDLANRTQPTPSIQPRAQPTPNPPAHQAEATGGRGRAQVPTQAPAGPAPVVETTACSVCGRQLPLQRCVHCDQIVCDTCKRSHVEQVRLDINRLVSQLRRGIPAFSDAISVIENKSEQLHQRADAGKADITETVERYISELRNRQRALHSEVQMWLLGEIRSLRMSQENVEVELASTASFCDSTEAVLQRANQGIPDEDLVDLRRQCVDHMEILRAYEDGSGVRLPRERRVQVEFEGNRFSQAISNFGELSVIESDNGSTSASSAPASLNSQSASSREVSPAAASAQLALPRRQTTGHPAPNTTGRAPLTDRAQNISLDRALAAIGSSQAPSSSPRLPARREERIGGLMGGAATNHVSPRQPARTERSAGWFGGASSSSPRLAPRGERGGAETGSQSRPTPRETLAGIGASNNREAVSQQLSEPVVRRQLPQSLSWELPVDFSYPPRADGSSGNTTGSRNSGTSNRRSLQERRRHNLSDSRLPAVLGGISSGTEPRSSNLTRRNRSGDRSGGGDQTSRTEPVAGTSGESSRPMLQRSRTFTREEFQPIREEDSQSRASTADPASRSRSPVSVELAGVAGNSGTSEMNTVNGGESTRVNVARNNYQDKGRAIIRFGSRGSEDNEFVWPRGIAISRSDQMYIADSSNHRVQVFDNIGTFIKTFGSYGQGDAEFDCLAGIAINTLGDILITDRYNHRIQVFDPQGNFKFKFGEEGTGDGQLMYPWGIATDNMGFIYVCDKENHRVQVFRSTGVFVRKFGRFGRLPGQFENPHYVAVSPDGKLYVSDSSNHRIQVFSIYGDFIVLFGAIGTMQGQMKYPKGIAIDDQGFVVVADSGNNRIQVFRGDGRFYSMFGSYGSDNGQFKGLEGLAILNNGNVVVSDRENHRIQIF